MQGPGPWNLPEEVSKQSLNREVAKSQFVLFGRVEVNKHWQSLLESPVASACLWSQVGRGGVGG